MAVNWLNALYILGAVLLLPSIVSNSMLYGKHILSLALTQFPRFNDNLLVNSLKPNDNDWFGSMTKEYDLACPEQKFRPYIFTFDPLIIYLENYLSYRETRYLIQLAKKNYEVSGLAKDYVAEKIVDPTIRSSKSAVLPEDPLVSCIERRSLDFQGFLPTSQIENLQTVKYETNDLFRSHYDWLNGVGADGKDNPRLSTIFAYVEADNVIGGSTQFPRIKFNFPEAWCKFIDCDSEIAKDAEGVGFKPIVGNAVLFMQYYANGTGHPDVLHQGMPVKAGTKIGMNIMTRQFPGYSHDF